MDWLYQFVKSFEEHGESNFILENFQLVVYHSFYWILNDWGHRYTRFP